MKKLLFQKGDSYGKKVALYESEGGYCIEIEEPRILNTEPEEFDGFCPCCGSDNIEGGHTTNSGEDYEDGYECADCGCQFTVHSHVVFDRVEVTKQGKLT